MKRIKCGCYWRKPGELEIEVEEGLRGGRMIQEGEDGRGRGRGQEEVEEAIRGGEDDSRGRRGG